MATAQKVVDAPMLLCQFGALSLLSGFIGVAILGYSLWNGSQFSFSSFWVCILIPIGFGLVILSCCLPGDSIPSHASSWAKFCGLAGEWQPPEIRAAWRDATVNDLRRLSDEDWPYIGAIFVYAKMEDRQAFQKVLTDLGFGYDRLDKAIEASANEPETEAYFSSERYSTFQSTRLGEKIATVKVFVSGKG